MIRNCPTPPDKVAAILHAWRQNLDDCDFDLQTAARRFGVTSKTISSIVRKAGLPTKLRVTLCAKRKGEHWSKQPFKF